MSETFPASSVRNAALLYGGMTAAAALATAVVPGARAALALPHETSAWLAGALAGAGLIAATWLAERTWRRFAALGDTMAAMLGPVTAAQALQLALWSGVGEEAVFRGPVQVALGPFAATLLFAALHGLGNRRLWPWPLFALVAGAVFAWLAWHFQSPWPGALAHSVVNAVNLRRLGRRYARRASSGSHG